MSAPGEPTGSHRELGRLVVVGAGAVGGTVGGLLFDAGLPVVLVARGEHGRAIRAGGLDLRLPEGPMRLDIPCVEHPSRVAWRPGDAVLLATKLQDARPALDDVLAAAGPDVPVVCATNGVHAERWAAERFSRVVSTVVWVLALHLAPGEVRLYSSGVRGAFDCGTSGEWGDGEEGRRLVDSLCAHLRVAGFDARPREDVAPWKHAKWITNLGGTALALGLPDAGELVLAARAEGEAVLDAAGLARIPTPEFRERMALVEAERVDGEERPGGSLWQSQARGTARETPWIEGAMARLAEEVGVPAPANARLAAGA